MRCSLCKKESNALTLIGSRFVCTSCNYNLHIKRYKYCISYEDDGYGSFEDFNLNAKEIPFLQVGDEFG